MNSVGARIVECDRFSHGFRFQLPSGKGTHHTAMGCLMTVCLAFVMISYGALKATELITYDETDVMVSQRDAYFNESFVYSENLWYAFGLSAYDDNLEPIEDPSYGVLRPYYKTWGLGLDETSFTEIPTRPCTKAELHVQNQTSEDSKFFKPQDTFRKDLEKYYKKLNCLDQDKVEVQGDYNTPSTRQFTLLFQRCDNSTFDNACKSEEEITRWMMRKFIIVYMNNERFSTRDYSENRVLKETTILWHPLNSQIREEVVY